MALVLEGTMAKEEEALSGRTLLTEMRTNEVYKRSQGRIVRQVTCIAIWAIVAIGAWQFHEAVLKEFRFADFGIKGQFGESLRYGIPLLLLGAGVWFGYRVVNWPRFADFLISVESEMNKVSWPNRNELVKASMVVIFTIFFMAMLLFCYDLVWQLIFSTLGVS